MSSISYEDLSWPSRWAAFDNLGIFKNTSTLSAARMKACAVDNPYVPVEGEKHAATAGSSLITFEVGMSLQHTADVELASFFAQRAADAKFDKATDMQAWHDEYLHALGIVGWGLRNHQYRQITASDSRFSIEQTVLRLMALATAGAGAAAMLLHASFKQSLVSLGKDEADLGNFDKHARRGRTGGFQMLPCGESQSGIVKVLLTCFHFTSEVDRGKVLFIPWGTHEIRMYGSAQMCSVNPAIFSRFREKIRTVVGERRKQDFDKIKLS